MQSNLLNSVDKWLEKTKKKMLQHSDKRTQHTVVLALILANQPLANTVCI